MAGFWMGTPQKFEQISNLSPEQMQLQKQLMGAAQGQGAGGAFGTAADYYRGLLSNESPDMEAFMAPEMRKYNEQLIPDLAQQFAGMGAGGSGLSGSGFRNAAIGQATDLSERLASMRAQLRQHAAAGLQGIGQQALSPYMQNYNVPAQQGFLSTALPALAGAAGSAFLGPLGGMAGSALGSWASSMFNPSTKASPTGAKPDIGCLPGQDDRRERAERLTELHRGIQPASYVRQERGSEDRPVAQRPRPGLQPALEQPGDLPRGQLSRQVPGRVGRLPCRQPRLRRRGWGEVRIGRAEVARVHRATGEDAGDVVVGGERGADGGAGIARGGRHEYLIKLAVGEDLADADAVHRDAAAHA